MVNDSPFAGEGSWLRCALHAHTTESDGELAPDLLARHAAGSDGLVTRARLELPAAARHIRVEITDATGRKAWANPVAV